MTTYLDPDKWLELESNINFTHIVHTVQCDTFKNSKKTGYNTSNNIVHSGHVTPGAIVSVINPVFVFLVHFCVLTA